MVIVMNIKNFAPPFMGLLFIEIVFLSLAGIYLTYE